VNLRGAWRPGAPRLRSIVAVSVILLAATLVAPLWFTSMEAPQYRGDEVLSVTVYAGRIAGSLTEIQTLNQYVGVHLPLDTAELRAAPWVLGALLVLAIVALVTPARRRRLAAAVLLLAMTLVAAGGAAMLQFRLYEMGHVRDDPIFEGVPDFTPPLLGTAKIANFTVHTGLGWGGWAYVAAFVLLGWGVLGNREPRPVGTGGAQQDEGAGSAPPPVARQQSDS
jgi:copper chaperone NosL